MCTIHTTADITIISLAISLPNHSTWSDFSIPDCVSKILSNLSFSYLHKFYLFINLY